MATEASKKRNENFSNSKTVECCEWINSHGRLPKYAATDETERIIGIWLNNKKGIRRGTIKGSWHDSDVKIAADMGHPHLFDRIRCRSADQKDQILKDIKTWISTNKRQPSIHGESKLEQRYAAWIAARKTQSRKKNDTAMIDKLATIGVQFGRTASRHEFKVELTKELCQWVSENGRIPHTTKKESKYFRTWKRLVGEMSQEEMDVLKSNDMMWILSEKIPTQNEINSNKMAEWVGTYFSGHGKLPTDDPQLSKWITRKKRIKALMAKGKDPHGTIYQSDIDILKKYSLESLLT